MESAAAEKLDVSSNKKQDTKAKHYLIRISAKRYDFEQDNVYVGINGEAPFLLKRGVAVPVPASVVEALSNAKHPIYTQKPGEDRKIVGQMERFPFEVMTRLDEPTYQKLRAISKERELTEEEVKKARGY